MNDLVVLESHLRALAPNFAQVLANRMPVERLMRTVLISIERLPKLLQCSQQSIMNAAMSAAVLGLEVDGVTGQAFLIPYGTNAQLVIGYKGFNTLGARSGMTITAGIVREGERERGAFDFSQGTGAFLKHRPIAGNKGRITDAWAVAEAKGRPPIISVLSIDDIMAIMAKSPGAKKSDSPWRDPTIGFPAMAEKSARRRLSRSMPLDDGTRDYHLAAALDGAVEEQGRGAMLRPDGNLILDAEVTDSPFPRSEGLSTPSLSDVSGQKPSEEYDRLKLVGDEKALEGAPALRNWFEDLTQRERAIIKPYLDSTLKTVATDADKARLAKGENW